MRHVVCYLFFHKQTMQCVMKISVGGEESIK